jgi:hypothetical protein
VAENEVKPSPPALPRYRIVLELEMEVECPLAELKQNIYLRMSQSKGNVKNIVVNKID